jgi:splicing factor 3A subunit 1
LHSYPGEAKVQIQCPDVEGSESLSGQLLVVEVASLMEDVGEVKERLTGVLKMAVGKLRLSLEGLGLLRDELSLAHYNVSPETMLQLSVKERGGRKK